MEHLTQSFSYIVLIGHDSWECHPRFIASKHSINPQLLITRTEVDFIIYICCNMKSNLYKATGMYADFAIK
jgi:hypothetical protein